MTDQQAARELWEHALALADRKDLAATQVFRAVLAAKAASERLEGALAQACTNLATIRPLDMLREGEDDISIGEAAVRWRDLVLEQAGSVDG